MTTELERTANDDPALPPEVSGQGTSPPAAYKGMAHGWQGSFGAAIQRFCSASHKTTAAHTPAPAPKALTLFCQARPGSTNTAAAEPGTSREIDLAMFRYVLAKLPNLQEVTFAGPGEPFLNRDLLPMVREAWDSRHIASHIITPGLLLETHTEGLLETRRLRLTVRLGGHSPTSYQHVTGLDPGQFSQAHQQLSWLMKQIKRRLDPDDPAGLRVWVSFLLPGAMVPALPTFLELAAELGVHGVVFENPAQLPYSQPGAESLYQDDETLLANFAAFDTHFQALLDEDTAAKLQPASLVSDMQSNQAADKVYQHPASGLRVVFPRLLPRQPEPPQRACRDPWERLTLDGDCAVGNCGQQATLSEEPERPRIWEEDCWEHPALQQLRQVHVQGNPVAEADAAASGTGNSPGANGLLAWVVQRTQPPHVPRVPVPEACRLCPQQAGRSAMSSIHLHPG
jgi:hypothetical protein